MASYKPVLTPGQIDIGTTVYFADRSDLVGKSGKITNIYGKWVDVLVDGQTYAKIPFLDLRLLVA